MHFSHDQFYLSSCGYCKTIDAGTISWFSQQKQSHETEECEYRYHPLPILSSGHKNLLLAHQQAIEIIVQLH